MQSMRSGRTPVSEFDRVDMAVHSDTGRISRVAIGGALVGLGIGRGGLPGALVCLVGLEPLLAGIFNFSLIGMVRDMFGPGEDYSQSTHYDETSPIGSTTSSGY